MEADPEVAPGARSILEAATEAFAHAGFDTASLTDIAAHAQVSKANIFHHFKSKEALYLEVMREASKGHAEFTEALLARDDLSSTQKIHALIVFKFEDLFGNELRSHLIVREIFNTGCRAGRNLIQPVFQRNFGAVTELIRQGQASGEFNRALDPAIVAWMIGATVMMFFQNRDSLADFPGLGGRVEPSVYAEKVCETLFGGLIVADADPLANPASTPMSTKSRK